MFYEDLFKYPCIIKLQTDDKILSGLVNKAIEWREPFFIKLDKRRKKVSFKDAVIWTTYVNYAKTSGLSDCIFISNNTDDFYYKEKYPHPELIKDYDKFNFHKDVDAFYKAYIKNSDAASDDFKAWFSSKNVDEKYVFKLLLQNEHERIDKELKSEIEQWDPRNFVLDMDYSELPGGYIYLADHAMTHCTDIENELIEDYAIISGTLWVTVVFYLREGTSGTTLNFVYHQTRCEEVAMLHFNFILKKDEKPIKFEVSGVEFVQ